jgi:streptogrisin C
VLAGAAVTGLPAASASPAAPTSSSSHTTSAPASNALLTAMQKDLGLTKTQAVARLAAEQKATAIESKAHKAAGAAYAGSWFDPDSNTMTVAVADPAKAAAVRATGATVRLVEHSARELDAVKKKIDRLHAPATVGSWRVDPQTNQVVIDVVAGHQSDNDVQKFVSQSRAAGPVQVEKTTQRPRTFAAGTVGGDPWYTGNVRCSIGFSVVGGFVSAGHCGQPGQSVSGWDGSYIGTIQGSTFPGNDWSWTNVGSGWWTVAVVLGWGTVSDVLVHGSAEAPIGASICRSGSTSHWHCGAVQAKNVTVNYSQGAVYSMTQTSVCAEPGDSGGSYISGDQAQGVTSGGTGDCTSGGTTFYQPLNPILSHFGLTLLTA